MRHPLLSPRRLHAGPVALGAAFHHGGNEDIARQPITPRHQQHAGVVFFQRRQGREQPRSLVQRRAAADTLVGEHGGKHDTSGGAPLLKRRPLRLWAKRLLVGDDADVAYDRFAVPPLAWLLIPSDLGVGSCPKRS